MCQTINSTSFFHLISSVEEFFLAKDLLQSQCMQGIRRRLKKGSYDLHLTQIYCGALGKFFAFSLSWLKVRTKFLDYQGLGACV